ncbi:MAG: hypothetical protein NTX72_00480 [Candidatus Uhrbacteria bacterium]|nr:hypothetical protein [Candidatus Uhrbacteria bacterium]
MAPAIKPRLPLVALLNDASLPLRAIELDTPHAPGAFVPTSRSFFEREKLKAVEQERERLLSLETQIETLTLRTTSLQKGKATSEEAARVATEELEKVRVSLVASRKTEQTMQAQLAQTESESARLITEQQRVATELAQATIDLGQARTEIQTLKESLLVAEERDDVPGITSDLRDLAELAEDMNLAGQPAGEYVLQLLRHLAEGETNDALHAIEQIAKPGAPSRDTSLLTRIQQLIHEVYEDAVALPRNLRAEYQRFVSERDLYQEHRHARKQLCDALIEEAPTRRARLDVWMSAMTQHPNTDDARKLEALLSQLQAERLQIGSHDTIMRTSIDRIHEIKNVYLETEQQLEQLRTRCERIRGACELFELSLSAEIHLQMEETAHRLALLNADDESFTQRENMLRFQADYPKLPDALLRLFEKVPEPHKKIRVAETEKPVVHVFTDAPTTFEAELRLLYITAHVCNPVDSKRKAKTMRSLTAFIEFSNLAPGSVYGDHSKDEEFYKAFDRERDKNHWRWIPHKEVRQLAEVYLALCHDKKNVMEQILRGKREYWELLNSNRKPKQTGTDS